MVYEKKKMTKSEDSDGALTIESALRLRPRLRSGVLVITTSRNLHKIISIYRSPCFSPILYNWYFSQAFNFRYFRLPHDSAKVISFK